MMNNKTNWTIYAHNKDAWLSMLSDCALAKESIVLEQFIFTTDDFGQRLIDICAERAKNGVKVRFLWDAAGSFTLWGSNTIEDLKKKGIELLFWKTLIPSYFKITNFQSWFLRNHRRTLVIDGKIGYTGSICIRDAMKNWRDTNVRIDGPIVGEMQDAFNRMWYKAQKRKYDKRNYSSNREFRYVTNYPTPGQRHIYREFLTAIRKAKKNIFITTPYFVPTRRLANAIKIAAKRGVDVRIIIPENSDHYAVDLGARSYFNSLLEHGIRIFLYHGNMIHSKAITIDDTWASIGTMNLDQISLLYNFEANIITSNNEFAKVTKDHFIEDLRESKEVNKEEWHNRFFLEKLIEILVRLIRRFL